MRHVLFCEGEFDAGLDEIVANAELAAPCVAAARNHELLRIVRIALNEHRHPQAVARALREVPRSAPFDAMSELEFLDLPALVVASRDVADPGHPYAVAAAYADRLPAARLISEAEGESPLPWQGGRLAREIEAFCAEPPVAARV